MEDLVKQPYHPNEEYLIICQEFKQTESCALLNKKLGKYYESVQKYMESIKQSVNVKAMMFELYEAK